MPRRGILWFVFIHSDPDGFWFIPKPIYTLPLTGASDRYGYFGVLYSPTISKYWSFTTRPVVTEVGEDNLNSAGRTTVKNMDSLHKPAVPGKCSDEDWEAFLSSNPLADGKSQVHGQPDGRYLTVVSDIFPTTRYFKWDAHNPPSFFFNFWSSLKRKIKLFR